MKYSLHSKYINVPITSAIPTHTHTHTCPRGVKAIQWSISSYWCVKTIREMEEDEKSIHPTERGGGERAPSSYKKIFSLSVGGFSFNKPVSKT